jgi:CRISPR-associated protein Cmr3
LGKALREGGWDLQNHKPRSVRSLIPAGSVFYCTVDNDDKDEAIKKLQTTQFDNNNPLDKALGRGLLTASFWFKHESLILSQFYSDG